MAANHHANPIPFNRFLTVASAGLVAFLAAMQGGLSAIGYRPCGGAGMVTEQNLQVASLELGIAAVAYLIFLLGARRLRTGWGIGLGAYNVSIAALLVGQGLLAYLFILSTVCVS